ncbi:MAG: cupin domain-containing protein [Gemmatimonadota bacterium]
MSVDVVNLGDLEYERFEGGVRFAADWGDISRRSGGRKLGAGHWIVPPGKASVPYHAHLVNEELFFVRRGYGQLRTPEGVRDVRPGDFFLCPPGPGGAHGVRNTGDGPLEILALSTMEEPEVSEYPDSGKIYVLVGAAPGGDAAVRTVDLLFRREQAVDYLDGER